MPQGNVFIPPVQPIAQAPQSIHMRPQPGQQQPGQQQPQPGQDQQGGDSAQLWILAGAIIEALIQKGVLTEEEVHNAVSMLQEGGNPMAQEKAPEGGKPEGGGFPGAADTQKGMGGENGKMSPSRGSY